MPIPGSISARAPAPARSRFFVPSAIPRSMLTLILGLVSLAVAGRAAAEAPLVPASAPLLPAAGARDPLLALLVGIVDQDRRGTFDRNRLQAEVARTGRTTRIPLDRFASVGRGPGADGTMRVSVVLGPKGDIPIPYDILGYHPGKLRLTRRLEMEEWRLGTVRFTAPGETRPVILEDVVLLGLRSGTLELDVDGWLDALLGPRLDDTHITGIALFRHDGARVSMAVGYSRTGRGQSGAFSLSDDAILFPRPEAYRAAGRYLRDRLERLAPETRRYAKDGGPSGD